MYPGQRPNLTEIDGWIALYCELEDIPIIHYDTTFYITEANLLEITERLMHMQIIQIKPTLEYLRSCRF